MISLADQQLLRDYTGSRSEPAFAELVRRHVDLVYSVALRMVRDAQLAEDVTQGVFMALAQNARQLSDRPVLSGWLHRTAQNIAAQSVRTDVRRRAREQEAVAMNESLSAEPDATWEHIAPHLDAALGELNEADRDALLLRYFENKNLREVGESLGTSDDAAQKRVSRAVERLREFFAKRGVSIGAGGLAVAISANAVQAAPVALAATISTAVALAGTTLATTTIATVTKAIAVTTLQKTLVAATLAIVAGTGIYEAHQASTLRTQVSTLQQQQAPLAGQLTQLKTENERLSSLVLQEKYAQALSQAQFSELLRLRGSATVAQADSRDLAKLKTTLAQQAATMPNYLTNAMMLGVSVAEKLNQQKALAKLARMKQMLNLTDDQERAISDIMTNHIHRESLIAADHLMGKLTLEQLQAKTSESATQEPEIKAVLTPEQLAAYPEVLQAEKLAAVDTIARSDAGQIAKAFSLSQEQQEQLRSLLYEMNLKVSTNALNGPAITQAERSGNFADAANMSTELLKLQLEEKLKVLEGVLSPEQIATYRKERMDRINQQAEMMKMLLPNNSAGTTN